MSTYNKGCENPAVWLSNIRPGAIVRPGEFLVVGVNDRIRMTRLSHSFHPVFFLRAMKCCNVYNLNTNWPQVVGEVGTA